MRVLDLDNKNESFEVGDIIDIDGFDNYLVTCISDGYTLSNMDGSSKFCSHYDSIHNLVNYMQNYHSGKYKVYSHMKYGIKLVLL